MTQRLYYQDSYTTQFSGTIVERLQDNGRTAVILDETYFYPTSGGQPHDTGFLNGIPVVDITVRAEDNAIVHWLADGQTIDAETVSGAVDWPRRFDHMQQHTGQHILSQAFIRVAEAETISFHLSPNSVTIDLNTDSLTPEQVTQTERLANDIIWQNRPLHVLTVTLEEAQTLPLRSIPPAREGTLRLINIDTFDLTACGGTHVAATGSVGIIKVVKLEKQKRKIRVEFCCGQRALQDYQQKNDVITQLSAELTTGIPELNNSVSRLKDENKEAQRAIKQLQQQLLGHTAQALLAEAQPHNGLTIIRHIFADDSINAGQLRQLANALTEARAKTVLLLAICSQKCHLLFSRTADAPGDMSHILQAVLPLLANGSGGGTAVTAQGGGAATKEQLQQILEKAEQMVQGQMG